MNLGRFDARLSNPETRKPFCDFFCKTGGPVVVQNPFMLPRFGPMYMFLFLQLAKGYGILGADILACDTAEKIDLLLAQSTTV